MKYVKPIALLLLIIFAGAIVYIFKHTTPVAEEIVPGTPMGDLQIQAREMADAFIKKDHETIVRYTYPQIIEAMGGQEKALEEIKKGLSGNVVFSKIELGRPSPIIDTGEELQSVIPETLESIIPEGTISGNSALIAISKDGGKNWYFIDRSGAPDLETFIKAFPNLSPKLVLPPLEEPTLKEN